MSRGLDIVNKSHLSTEELSQLAEVDSSFVIRAEAAGALTSDERGFSSDDVIKCRLLKAWDSSGLSVEAVGELVKRGELQLSFLGGARFLAVGSKRAQTYADLSREMDIDIAWVQSLYEALGLDPPVPTDLIREDDRSLFDWAKAMLAAGLKEAATLRLARVYSGVLRRISIAEVEAYESVEEELRTAGATEQDLLAAGGRAGQKLPEQVERALLDIYRRHRQNVWLNHSVGHVEVILEEKGLYERLAHPPCVCFVDLTGFTRLTEERGDRVAAETAAGLQAIVDRISKRFWGRPVRWLGDGGMFVFQEPTAAVSASETIRREVAKAGLPPTHIGLHCGPVIFQDGDVYGRTVNVASRLSSLASAGEILVSADVVRRVERSDLFELVGDTELRGVTEPLTIYRVRSQTSSLIDNLPTRSRGQ